MKGILAVIFGIGIVGSIQAQSSVVRRPLSIGEEITLFSDILNEERKLNIYLPEKYDSGHSYSVLYLLDGSMNEDFLHIVGLTQFFHLMFGMPEMIVVGIANVDRKRDFTFHTDLEDLREKYPTTGHSERFIRFVEEELKPFMDRTYSVGDTQYVLGQSLGGLLVTEILLQKPHLFSHYLIVSPSLWWDNESLLKVAGSLYRADTDDHRWIYISVGRREHRIMRKEAKCLYKALMKAGEKKAQLHFKEMKEENHATILHRSIYEAFLILYPYSQR